MCSCELYEVFKDIYFYRTALVVACASQERTKNHRKANKFNHQKISIDNVKVESLNRTFTFQREFNKLQKEVLIILPNLKYTELIEIYEHLIGIQMNERDTKLE